MDVPNVPCDSIAPRSPVFRSEELWVGPTQHCPASVPNPNPFFPCSAPFSIAPSVAFGEKNEAKRQRAQLHGAPKEKPQTLGSLC